jgi:hypothetical protein
MDLVIANGDNHVGELETNYSTSGIIDMIDGVVVDVEVANAMPVDVDDDDNDLIFPVTTVVAEEEDNVVIAVVVKVDI